jgi:uncharacterized protein (DUF2235 family)
MQGETMGRNLVLLFDGTWNNARDKTNVLHMRESIDSTGEEDPFQPTKCLSGVGTNWHTWLTGGLFGRGLSENIQAGYAWLAGRHLANDNVFVFGFSRGAYSARSCVGLIRKCGLLKSADLALVQQAYALYRDKKIAPDHARAAAFRAAHSREIRVRFVGVWDTVGALGVPLSGVPFSKDYYRWHDTSLSKIVDYGYHAIAADERRADYKPAVWTNQDHQKKPENIDIEQRWFIGAHANVGGGYEKQPPDRLPAIALRWIQEKAEAAGLKLRARQAADPLDCMAPVNDSFKEFVFGAYALFNRPYKRPFGRGVNETIDPSVWARWIRDRAYRPASLARHPAHPVEDVESSAAQPS